jgi:hypothetical protein
MTNARGHRARTKGETKNALHVVDLPQSVFTAQTVKGDSAARLDEMERRGARKHRDRLRPTAETTTMSMSDGELVARHGPFAETKDEVVGYDLIERADFDDGIEIA